jgi:hypothetical protein
LLKEEKPGPVVVGNDRHRAGVRSEHACYDPKLPQTPCSNSNNMRYLAPILLLLALTNTLQATPLTRAEQAKKEVSSGFSWDSIPWKKYLPTAGALGAVGILAGLVFLGTHAEQTYQEEVQKNAMVEDGQPDDDQDSQEKKWGDGSAGSK